VPGGPGGSLCGDRAEPGVAGGSPPDRSAPWVGARSPEGTLPVVGWRSSWWARVPCPAFRRRVPPWRHSQHEDEERGPEERGSRERCIRPRRNRREPLSRALPRWALSGSEAPRVPSQVPIEGLPASQALHCLGRIPIAESETPTPVPACSTRRHQRASGAEGCRRTVRRRDRLRRGSQRRRPTPLKRLIVVRRYDGFDP